LILLTTCGNPETSRETVAKMYDAADRDDKVVLAETQDQLASSDDLILECLSFFPTYDDLSSIELGNLLKKCDSVYLANTKGILSQRLAELDDLDAGLVVSLSANPDAEGLVKNCYKVARSDRESLDGYIKASQECSGLMTSDAYNVLERKIEDLFSSSQ
jgi:hypothetical protein